MKISNVACAGWLALIVVAGVIVVGPSCDMRSSHVAAAESDSKPASSDSFSSALARFEFERVEMAVPVKVVFYAPDKAAASTAASAAFDEIHRLNAILSDYDPQSELRRLCRTAGRATAVPEETTSGADPTPSRAVAVSDDLWNVLQASQRMARLSDGAFDVTVGPVVKLWRRARRRHRLPTEQRLAEARERVGYQMIRLHPEGRKVELLRPDMRLDLGGIAKGYAVDAALDVLRRHGVTRALIDAGGDIRLGGPPPGEVGWRIAVAGTDREEPSAEVLLLANTAIATSGDAWQHVEIRGVRYSHIVDPRTGVGLTDRATVTVVAPTGMLADSLASAVSVLGPEPGIELVQKHPGAAVQIVRSRDDKQGGPVAVHGPGWAKLPRASPGGEAARDGGKAIEPR